MDDDCVTRTVLENVLAFLVNELEKNATRADGIVERVKSVTRQFCAVSKYVALL